MRFQIPTGDWRFWAIFAAGLLLRGMQPGLVQYGIDEGSATALALQISHGVHFATKGLMTSFGFHNPPLFLYLLAPFTLLSIDPGLLGICFALIGSSAIWFAYDTARRIGGNRAAILAAIIVALCPNAIEHSRRIWGHDLMVAFSSAVLWCAVLAHEKKNWKFLAASFSFCVMAQCVHLSGVLLWPIPLAIFFAVAGREKWKALATGISFLVLCYLPWIAADAGNNFMEMRVIISTLGGHGGAKDLGLVVSPHAAWALVLSDFWSNDLLGAARPFMLSKMAFAASVTQTACSLGLLGIAICAAILLMKNRQGSPAVELALLLGIVAPLLLFGLFFRAAVPPYLLPALVPSAVCAACAMGRETLSRRNRFFAAALIALYAFSSVTLVVETRRQILRGVGTSIPATEKSEAITFIASRSLTGQAFVMQDGRQKNTGLDIAYVVLAHDAVLGLGEITSEESPFPIFVIVDHRSLLRPQVANYLRHQPGEEFQHLTVYTIRQAQRASWLELVERFPAVPPPP
ncbi:MAG: glycosyltransferase family 39 protein [Candidatus Sumerlaeota bacterium]